MKLLYFDDFRLGVLAGNSVVDVTDVVADIPHLDRRDLMGGLIEGFDTAIQGIKSHFGGVRQPSVPF